MRARIGSVELGYELRGSGPALLLLHAFPLDRRMWDETAALLAGERRVIALDLRGFGESTGQPSSLELLADDAVRLLDQLGVVMATVVGLSMGGYVALALARHHPARLARLVLADTRAGADSLEGKRGRDQGIARLRDQGVAPFVEPMLERLLSPGAPASVRERVRAIAVAQRSEAIAAALAALRDRPDRTGELGAIACPTLVMVGEHDPITPPADARKMAAAISGARLVELRGAGHLTAIETPALFCATLSQFLDES